MRLFNARLCAIALLPTAPAFAQDQAAISLGPLEYKTVTNVVEAAKSKPLRVIPAVMRRENTVVQTVPKHCPGDDLTQEIETVEIVPEMVEFEIIQPTYRTVTEEVVLAEGGGMWTALDDGSFAYSTVEPETRTVTRRVIDTPAASVRRVKPAIAKSINIRKFNGLGGICSPSIEVPAQTVTVTRSVIEKPARVAEVESPDGTEYTGTRVPLPQTVTLRDASSGEERSATTAIFPSAPVEIDKLVYRPVFRRADPRCVQWLGLARDETENASGDGFPWPMPRPSYAATMPPLAIGTADTLDGFEAEFRTALDGLKYEANTLTHHAVPGGFVLVTAPEQIDRNGRPAPERWPTGIIPPATFSIEGWREALKAAEGRFRVMAIVVTAKTASPDSKDWLGGETPPAFCGVGGGAHSIAVLVYEFENQAPSEPSFARTTKIDHMDGSGLGWLEP